MQKPWKSSALRLLLSKKTEQTSEQKGMQSIKQALQLRLVPEQRLREMQNRLKRSSKRQPVQRQLLLPGLQTGTQ